MSECSRWSAGCSSAPAESDLELVRIRFGPVMIHNLMFVRLGNFKKGLVALEE
jgi:hypothetical protein